MVQHRKTPNATLAGVSDAGSVGREYRGRRMNFHKLAAVDRHAWRIFQSYLP
jgi:hypothetical protein